MGLADIVVVGQGLVDQAHQLRIVEEPPPLLRHLATGGEGGALRTVQATGRCLGLAVVGADAACSQGQGHQGYDKYRLHGWLSRVSANERARAERAVLAWSRAIRL